MAQNAQFGCSGLADFHLRFRNRRHYFFPFSDIVGDSYEHDRVTVDRFIRTELAAMDGIDEQ